MKFIYTLRLKLIITLILVNSIAIFTASAQIVNKDYLDGKVYFKYKDSEAIRFQVNKDGSVPLSTVPELKDLAIEFAISEVKRPFDYKNDAKLLRTLEVEISDAINIDQFIVRLSQNKSIEYVEKVPYDRIDLLPNDSLYNLYNGPQNWNWHLELIHGSEAWDLTTGDPNIKVAVVDNAVWVDHPDLAGKIVAQRDVVYGTNNANPPSSGNPDEWSHGTHVSGLIGASSNNNIGVASIGYNVSLIAVKAANNSNPTSISGGYSGIQWAANNGADIINMSWGGPGFSQTNQNLINSIAASGVVLIAAAGNDNTSSPHYPSAYQNVISVASVDYNDVKSDFSNYSTTVDISSPGGAATPGPAGLLSTTFSNNTLGYYDSYEGTSMACPVVSGVASLILSVNPALSPAEVENILKTTADDITAQNPNYTTTLGAGRVNAYEAVKNTPFQPTAVFSTPIEIITPGTTINFIDQSTGIPSTWEWTFEGGAPSSSTSSTPGGITFNAPGTYDITLTVTNSYGSSSTTYNDYIQVVANPAPYIFITVSNDTPCIGEVVELVDSSIYAPTSWEWLIEPSTFQFVNGTTSSSQNPEIEFLNQGFYNVTLTAYNQNGNSSRLFENVINVRGIAPNYVLDMEDGTPGYFTLWDTIKSQSAVDHRASNNSQFGIHFHGDPIPTGWKGSPTDGTPDQAWAQNLTFQAEAHLCGIDARNLTNLKLAFDLRQTYSLGPKYSWFRVLVNGNPIQSWEGITDYNPETAGDDQWKRVEYDLSAFAGQIFDVTLQACNRFSDRVQGQGDNVFIDNLEITINVPVIEVLKQSGNILIYPNPSNGNINIIVPKELIDSNIEIINSEGKIIQNTDITGNLLNLTGLPSGLYFARVINKSGVSTVKFIVTGI